MEDLRKQKNSSENGVSGDRESLLLLSTFSLTAESLKLRRDTVVRFVGPIQQKASFVSRKLIFVAPPGRLLDRTCVQDSSVKAPPVGMAAWTA